MSASFLLVRHAQSVWNAAGRWQGQADPPLSERGREQALELARKLAGEIEPDRLLCSDLQRARHTAEVLGRVLRLEPEPLSVLRELDVGKWSGLTRAEIEAMDPDTLDRFEAGEETVRAGGGESRAEIRARVVEAFHALANECAGADVVVVTHLGVVRALVPGAELGHTETVRVVRDDFRDLG